MINILLPYKETFSHSLASSVSITVKNNLEFSKYSNNTYVFGKKIEKPFFKEKYVGLKINWLIHGGKNKSLANNFCKYINQIDNKKQLIEFHNRPYLFRLLKEKIKNNPIIIYFHNDPLTMKGSKTINERMFILQNAAAVICVSKFVKQKFLTGIDKEYKNIHFAYNGVKRNLDTKPKKLKEILFVGKIIKEKGVDTYVNAVHHVSKIFWDWKFSIIGSSYSGQNKLKKEYSKKVLEKFVNIGDQTKYYGFIDNDSVNKKMKESSIVVVPSVWEEPFGLVAAEAISNGAALIVSNKGGLPEIVDNNGIVINNINSKNLSESLYKLMSDDFLLKELQNKSWKNFNFDIKNTCKSIDSIRDKIIKEYFN